MRLQRKIPGNSAFTLIELMVVIMIIGILAAIAIPTYMKYIKKSRLTEAMKNIQSIVNYENMYWLENNKYVRLSRNPLAVPKGGDKQNFITTVANWSALGNIMANNSALFFQYQAFAGKMNADGNALLTTDGLLDLRNRYGTYRSGDGSCTYNGVTSLCCVTDTAANRRSFRLVDTKLDDSWNIQYKMRNTNFLVVTAVADQDADGICSYIRIGVTRQNDYVSSGVKLKGHRVDSLEPFKVNELE